MNSNGDETHIEAYYFYDGEDYSVQFKNLLLPKDPAIEVSMKTSVSKFDVGEWNNLRPGDASKQVMAEHRQPNESDFYIEDTDWVATLFI